MTRICDRAHHPEKKKKKKISWCAWFKLWTSVGGGEDKLDKAACTVFKGIASRDGHLFEGPKCQNSDFWLGGGCWWFSQFLTVFLPIKSKQKFLLAFIKSVTNCEILSRNPFSGILFRLSDSLLILKIDPKVSKNVQNGPMKAKQSRKKNLYAAFETIFRINKCFQEASRNVILIFIFNYAG